MSRCWALGVINFLLINGLTSPKERFFVHTKKHVRYNTFNAVYKERWKDVLGFRQRSLFSTCEVCYAFKTQLANRSISMEQKLGCSEAYRQHLHDTFCDRTMIWSMQAESADFNSSILVIATDGLDQSKFALPREPEMRINSGLTFRSNGMIFQMFCNTLKILLVNLVLDLPAPASLRAKHQRPRMKVHGTWAMGYQLNVFLMDETARHDSSAIIEMLALTIEKVGNFWTIMRWVNFQLCVSIFLTH